MGRVRINAKTEDMGENEVKGHVKNLIGEEPDELLDGSRWKHVLFIAE